jgi:peptidoglycan/LPS O-acetylase OafA/YrhL
MIGVEFFFVLSGFVMGLMHGGEIGPGGRPLAFFWRRACRIYPIYLIVLASQVWRYSGSPMVSLENVLAWASLLPIRADNLVVVAWTLRQEVVFYVLFALCLLPRVGAFVLGGWVVSTLLCWFGGISVTAPGWIGIALGHAVSAFNFEFFAGLLAAFLFRRAPRAHRAAALMIFAGAVLVTWRMWSDGWGAYGPPASRLAYGLGYGAILLGCSLLERGGAVAFRSWPGRVAVAAGAISYPLYLCHVPVIGWVSDRLVASGAASRLGSDVVFALFATASLAAAAVLTFAFDQPIQALLRGRLPRLLPRVEVEPAARG